MGENNGPTRLFPHRVVKHARQNGAAGVSEGNLFFMHEQQGETD
jgi:hypothetical protein